MYDLEYVKKRKRRRLAALVSLFSSIGVASLVVVSFLGRTVGTFTVSIQNSTVKLALCEKSNFEEPTSYLRIDNIPNKYTEYTYKWLENKGFDVIDDENRSYYFGLSEDGEAMGFLKYTFYIKNIGTKLARYTLSVNLEESTKGDNGKTLDDTLRIMLFENDPAVEDSHNFDVYAKELSDLRYKVKDIKGNYTNQAFISKTPAPASDGIVYEDETHRLAEPFLTNRGTAIIQKEVDNFGIDDMMRYTVVYWLEGDASIPEYDAQGNPLEPKGAKIKLSIDINASSNGIA